MADQKVKVDGVEFNLEAKPSECVESENEYKLLEGEKQEYRPVECVTWYDAVYFCNILSQKTCLKNAYEIKVKNVDQKGHIIDAEVNFDKTKNGYRLPTEAEWEYAARGGSYSTPEQFEYYFSGISTTDFGGYADPNDDLDIVAWYYMNSLNIGDDQPGYGTHQVGKKKENAAGLYDMSGNVWEYCSDFYGEIKSDENVTDPIGASKNEGCCIRGGSWSYKTEIPNYAVSGRGYSDVTDYSNNVGFRICRNAK